MTTNCPVDIEALRKKYIGRKSTPSVLDIEKGHIIAFAEAIGDPNPMWNDEEEARGLPLGGMVASPTFLRASRTESMEIADETPFKRILDGGSQWDYYEPVRAGDRISVVTRVDDLVIRSGSLGSMLFVSLVATYTNQFQRVVATQTSTLIRY
mgnify:CR=1 FL=1|tara:strand:+ start:72 stop:530 length:459 start_codon:yes stop_codon:yes gene_type:complete